MKKMLKITLGLSLLSPTLVLSDVNRECRGVAAGVVSSMRASNEIDSEAVMKTALTAARRSCVAALEGFSSDDFSESEESGDNLSNDDKYMKKMSVFEFLTQEQEKNAGHDRIKR